MNKKGFTIVELIVSFSLAAMIGFFLLRITMVIKDLYTDSYVKTNIMSKQNIMTERMYDDFLYNDVKVVLKCGNNCLRFIFSDNSEKIFEIENENTFKWGDFTLKLTDGSKYSNATTNNRKSLITTKYNDSLLSIKIPIINKILSTPVRLISFSKSYFFTIFTALNTLTTRINLKKRVTFRNVGIGKRSNGIEAIKSKKCSLLYSNFLSDLNRP